jgi:hypothetical protein
MQFITKEQYNKPQREKLTDGILRGQGSSQLSVHTASDKTTSGIVLEKTQ